MSSELYYPTLDANTVKNLDMVRQLSLEHAAYWLTSPYSPDIEKLIKAWFDPKSVRELVNKARKEEDKTEGGVTLEENRYEFLYNETKTLYTGLKDAKYIDDNEGSMAYFKAAVGLIKELISLQERSLGLKNISDHNNLIMSIMEDVLSPTQRQQVMGKLQEALGQTQ